MPCCECCKMREELLVEIDRVLMGSPFWQGGRLDTIRWLVGKMVSLHTAAHASVPGSLPKHIVSETGDCTSYCVRCRLADRVGLPFDASDSDMRIALDRRQREGRGW